MLDCKGRDKPRQKEGAVEPNRQRIENLKDAYLMRCVIRPIG